MVSVDDFNKFLGLFVQMCRACYLYLSSIQIAGLTMFEWILGFMAAGVIFSIIRVFAGVGGVSVSSVGAGAAETFKTARADTYRKTKEAERAAEKAHRETYEYYEKTRSRNEVYKKRYDAEHE